MQYRKFGRLTGRSPRFLDITVETVVREDDGIDWDERAKRRPTRSIAELTLSIRLSDIFS